MMALPRLGRLALSVVSAVGLLACDAPPRATAPDLELLATDLQVADDGVVFADIRDAVATPDGLWILDGHEPFLTRLDLDGTVQQRFGSRGRGPSELLQPRAIQSAGSGRHADLLVWDPGNARVSRFGAAGDLVAVTPEHAGHAGIRSDLPDVTYVDPFRVRRVGTHFAYVRYPAGLSRTADLSRGRLTMADAAGLERGWALGGTVLDGDARAGGAGELAGLPLWDGCGDLGLAVWAPDERAVTWLDPGGSAVLAVSVPIRPRRLDETDIERYLGLMARLELGADPEDRGLDLPAMARSSRELFAREAPVATELRCGVGHEAWLRLFDTSSDALGRGRDWLVVDAMGFTRVRLPVGFSPLVILADRIVGVLEEARGQRIAWWIRGTLPPNSSPQTLE